jgi:hypothetical protein
VQHTAALAATFLRRFFHAHPVSPRGAFGIQTLHRPTWKLLHFTSRAPKFIYLSWIKSGVACRRFEKISYARKTGGIVRRCL